MRWAAPAHKAKDSLPCLLLNWGTFKLKLIIINFPPGALGFLVLKTIHAHWAEKMSPHGANFFFKHLHDNNSSHNHSVQPDLFLRDQTCIPTAQLESLHHLSTVPSIVFVHNANLIPWAILNKSTCFTISCNVDALRQSNFLFWSKNTKYIFDYITQQGNKSDFYQAAYLQLVRGYRQPTPDIGNQIIFQDLSRLDSLVSLLDSVKHENQLGDYSLMHNWYKDNYNRSIAPLVDNLEIYRYFAEILHELDQEHHDYQTMLSTASWAKFKIVVDFFYQSYKNQLTQPLTIELT